MASRWSRRRLSESLRDWVRRLVSTLPSGPFALALERCSFSSGSQPELLFLAGFTSPFGSCPFLLGSQALFSFLGTFVGLFDSCSFALSCEALFPLLAGFVGPFESCPFAFSCEALFPMLAGFAGSFESYALAFPLWPSLRSLHFALVLQNILPFPAEPQGILFPTFLLQIPLVLFLSTHHAPHQSLSIPMTSLLRDTNKLRESSALPAMRGPVFRIFPL